LRSEELMSKIIMMVGDGEFYGYEIHKILQAQGIKIEISRLYRLLNEMLSKDWFNSKWIKSQSGPQKRMYTLGKEGRRKRQELLLEAIGVIHKFYGEYLRKLPSELNVFNKMVNFTTSGLIKNSKIGLVNEGKTKMVDVIIKELNLKVPSAKIYLITPGSIKDYVKIDNLLKLEGTYDSIPLKNSFLDLLIVMGIPKIQLFISAIKEWSRLMHRGSKLVIMSPTVLIRHYADPKNIGQFFEEYEHYEADKTEKIGLDSMKQELKKIFKKVQEKSIIHLTLLKASEPLVFENFDNS